MSKRRTSTSTTAGTQRKTQDTISEYPNPHRTVMTTALRNLFCSWSTQQVFQVTLTMAWATTFTAAWRIHRNTSDAILKHTFIDKLHHIPRIRAPAYRTLDTTLKETIDLKTCSRHALGFYNLAHLRTAYLCTIPRYTYDETFRNNMPAPIILEKMLYALPSARPASEESARTCCVCSLSSCHSISALKNKCWLYKRDWAPSFVHYP